MLDYWRTERPFRVRIENDKDVGDLQRTIKDRKIENIDEADLKLWKVTLRVIMVRALL